MRFSCSFKGMFNLLFFILNLLAKTTIFLMTPGLTDGYL